MGTQKHKYHTGHPIIIIIKCKTLYIAKDICMALFHWHLVLVVRDFLIGRYPPVIPVRTVVTSNHWAAVIRQLAGRTDPDSFTMFILRQVSNRRHQL